MASILDGENKLKLNYNAWSIWLLIFQYQFFSFSILIELLNLAGCTAPNWRLHSSGSFAVSCGHVSKCWPMGCQQVWCSHFLIRKLTALHFLSLSSPVSWVADMEIESQAWPCGLEWCPRKGRALRWEGPWTLCQPQFSFGMRGWPLILLWPA